MLKSVYWRLAPRLKRWLVKRLQQFSLLDKLNLTLTLSINSVPFRIPVLRGVGCENVFMTEMWMVEVLQQLLPLKPGVFLDVGANIGQSLLKLRAVSKTIPYVGLEPNPACAAYTGDLIRANRFDKTVLIPVGLHNSRDILNLSFFAEGNSVDSGATLVQDSAFRPQHPVVFRQPVPVFPYTDIAKFLDGVVPGIIKIDVEGGEFEVLDSLRDLTKTERCPILVEILPMGSPKDTLTKNTRIETFFSDLGYLIYRIEKNRERFARFAPLDHIGLNTDPAGWDYLATPVESQGAIEAANVHELNE